MPKAKIAITLEPKLLKELDGLIKRRKYSNRSHAIQEAVSEHLRRFKRSRFEEECAKFDPQLEQALADEGLAEDVKSWPEY
jgi:metal-responsive CopG/Arc/MetJ family transcriptional regulator